MNNIIKEYGDFIICALIVLMISFFNNFTIYPIFICSYIIIKVVIMLIVRFALQKDSEVTYGN